MLDEPVNGLDPEGVQWVRQLVRSLADGGMTVLISSHLMAEMALSADHLIIMGRDRYPRLVASRRQPGAPTRTSDSRDTEDDKVARGHS